MQNKRRIFSLDGGGIGDLMTAAFLEEMEEATGKLYFLSGRGIA